VPSAPRSILVTATALVVAACGLTLAACGGEPVPGNAVATVDNRVISKDAYERWFAIVARSQPSATGGAPGPPPDPPDFKRCIAAKQRQPSQPGQPRPRLAQLREACQQEYEAVRDQTMQLLISAAWIQGQAEKMGVTIPPGAPRRELDSQIRQAFPDRRQYQQYLRQTGLTEADLLFRAEIQLKTDAITKRLEREASRVTPQQVRTYFDRNIERFGGRPERRDIRVIVTKTEAEAEEVLAELERGAEFEALARARSTDQTTKRRGGRQPNTTKNQLPRELGNAVFTAEVDEFIGPIKTNSGWYVVEVQRIKKGKVPSFRRVAAQVRQQLIAERQQARIQRFSEEFEKRWKGMTLCRDQFAVELCSNAPPPEPQPVIPGGVPGQGVPQQGAPQQQAPQQGAPQQVPQQGGQ
jgi:foldase protein PrsA